MTNFRPVRDSSNRSARRWRSATYSFVPVSASVSPGSQGIREEKRPGRLDA